MFSAASTGWMPSAKLPVEVEDQPLPMSRFLPAMLFALLLVGCATTRSTHWKPPMCRRCMAAMHRIARLCSNMT